MASNRATFVRGPHIGSQRSTYDTNVSRGRIRTRSSVSRTVAGKAEVAKNIASPRASIPRSKKERKSKADKAKTRKLNAPLSVLTADMHVPLKDMEAWVNRSREVRRQEVTKRQGYITRPMNSFMLYRSAYAERTKQWGKQNNHQVVSSLSGESWPMETKEVRDQYNEWARIERSNHQAAHPEYKFSPSKNSSKRKRIELSDDEESYEADNDDDGDYHTSKRPRRPATPWTNTPLSVPYSDSDPLSFASSTLDSSPTQLTPLKVNANPSYHSQPVPYLPWSAMYYNQPTYTPVSMANRFTPYPTMPYSHETSAFNPSDPGHLTMDKFLPEMFFDMPSTQISPASATAHGGMRQYSGGSRIHDGAELFSLNPAFATGPAILHQQHPLARSETCYLPPIDPFMQPGLGDDLSDYNGQLENHFESAIAGMLDGGLSDLPEYTYRGLMDDGRGHRPT